MFWSATLSLSESSEWHSHDVFELVFCLAGTGLLVLDEQCIELVSWRSILINPKARHRYVFKANEGANLRIVCVTADDAVVYLSPAQTAVLRQMRRTGGTFTDFPEGNSHLWKLAEGIPDGLGQDDPGELQVVWGTIALLLASHLRAQNGQSDSAGLRHLETIRKVCGWLDNQLEHSGDLDDLAARFGLSRSLLTREFRRHTGSSITDYLNTRRLQKAGMLLASSEQSISEVAFESGFASLPNFYRRFKELYGITPAEFREHLAGHSNCRTPVPLNISKRSNSPVQGRNTNTKPE